MPLTVALLAITLAGAPRVQVTVEKPHPAFSQRGPYDPAVPTPESILGYRPGSTHTVFRDQERVVQAIAAKAPGRVREFTFGKSTQGRPLRVYAISSPRNIARLEQIRQAMTEVANPTDLEKARRLAKDLPVFIWINECIHGDETAAFESAMWLMYNLAASRRPEITQALENSVILLNPVYNPDGHERYVVWYNSIATGAHAENAFEQRTPSVSRGRANHYRFDMNRDRVALSQDESRAEVREFLRWNPQVYVDQHGQTRNYFFPPNPMAINANVDRDRLNKWADIFGRATAADFDKEGWLYFIKEDFDLYYPGYLDSWATLSGAIGMTHETDGGRTLANLRDDGTVLTLHDGMARHLISALAVIRSASARRQELIESYLTFRHRALTGESAGSFQRVVMWAPDPRSLDRLADQLDRHGIRYRQAKRAFSQDDATHYWTGQKGRATFAPGSLVVDVAQPQGALVKALMETSTEFEPEFAKEMLRRHELERKESPDPDAGAYEFYDLTGWALPYAHDLYAWWCSTAPNAPELGDYARAKTQPEAKGGPVGYRLNYTELPDALAAIDLMQAGVRLQHVTRPLVIGGETIQPGTFLAFRDRNGDDLDEQVLRVARKRGVRFLPLETGYPSAGTDGLGSAVVRPLRKTSIAVVFGENDALTAMGPTWYLMDREFRLPFTPISTASLGSDLSDFSVIVLPAGRYASVPTRLREWVSAGGCVILLGEVGWAVREGGFARLDPSRVNGRAPTSVPGSIFLGELSRDSWLSYGFAFGDRKSVPFAVPLEGGTFYKARNDGSAAVRIPKSDSGAKLLTGWAWPEDSAPALSDTVWVHDERVGRGRAVLFMTDPTDRAMWPGLWKLFVNALVFGAR